MTATFSSNTTVHRSTSFTVDSPKLRANTENIRNTSEHKTEAAPMLRGGQVGAGYQARYLSHNHNLNTFALNVDKSREVGVTGMANLGAEVMIKYKDAAGEAHIARGGPELAQTMRERNQALVGLAKTVRGAMDGGKIDSKEAAQIRGMLESIKGLQTAVKADVAEILAKPGEAAPKQAPVYSPAKPAEVAYSDIMTAPQPTANGQGVAHTSVDAKIREHKPIRTTEHPADVRVHAGATPAHHSGVREQKTSKEPASVEPPKSHSTSSQVRHHTSTEHHQGSSKPEVHAKTQTHSTHQSSGPSEKHLKHDLANALEMIRASGSEGADNAALHLVQTRPELLKVATPNQLGSIVANLTGDKVSDADRAAVLKVLDGKSGSEITQIINCIEYKFGPDLGGGLGQMTVTGSMALGTAFVGHDSEHKLAELLESKGLVGEKSPLRGYFLNYAGLGDGEMGFKSLGTIDSSDSDDHSRKLARSRLMLDAATPSEKAKMLCSLMDGDTGSDDERGLRRIMDSVKTKGELDAVTNAASQYGWSIAELRDEMNFDGTWRNTLARLG